jgi:trehalose 6-phosphate phosphatase
MFRSALRRLDGVAPSRVLLATDFDGTLGPIVPRPEDARPLPAASEALRLLTPRLAGVAILSGRATATLRELLPVPGLRLRGDYGLGEPSPEEAARLASFASEMAAEVASHRGAWLEAKPGSASVHYREQPGAGPALLAAAGEVAGRLGLRVHAGRLVVEVLPERAGKGTALGQEIAELRPEAVMYAGDDTGDQPCFELLHGLEIRHLAVGVASGETSPDLFRLCDLVVEGPPAFAELLSHLAAWAEARGHAGPGSGG